MDKITTRAAQHEPPPTGNGVAVYPLVIADIEARVAAGYNKYGTLLRAQNGRDALMDAYQEAIDLVMYLRQAMLERDIAADPARLQDGEVTETANAKG